jgi:hypothetical protein
MLHPIRRFLVLSALILIWPATAEPADKAVLRLRAFAVNMSGVGRASSTTLDIVFERWSSDEERKKLLDTLVEKDDDALLSALEKIKPRAGYIRTSTSLGWDIQYARMQETPSGGKRIIFGTDRPMGFYELRNNQRTTDYEFMVCEIRLGANGQGEGKLSVATKIRFDKESRTLELENYGIEPVRLTKVTVEK